MYAPAFIIADANSIYRCGMANLLKEQFTDCTTTEVADVHTLIAAVHHHWFNVILMDVSLPPVNGFEAARSLTQLYSNCCIVLYAYERSEQVIIQAFAAGAVCFFNRDETAETIIYKIEEVLQKGCCITSHELKAYKAAHTRIFNPQPNHKILTLREKEVLQLIQKGSTSKQIAAQLHRSPKTIDNHRSNIMTKTGTHNIAQLVLYAQEMGYV